MKGSLLSRFFLPLLLLCAVAALLWTSYGFASAYRLFGSTALSSLFHAGALAATAVTFVFVTATLVARVGVGWWLQTEPTPLQRGLIVAGLTFIAAAISLWASGFNLGTILTTSALVTVLVGVSVQPMVASLVSGLTVHGLIRKGDAVLLDGEPAEITALHWRSLTARKKNGVAVVVPNARLAQGSLEVLAYDRPARVDLQLEAPASVAPHRVRKVVEGLVEDLPEADGTRPVNTFPLAYDASRPTTRYQVSFWVQHFAQRAEVEGRILRRCWYAFQREGLAAPSGSPAESAAHVQSVVAALRENLPEYPDLRAAPEQAARSLLAASEVLAFDEGERIVLPERLAGRSCFLLEGHLSESAAEAQEPLAPMAFRGGPRSRQLSLVTRALARRIGPYAVVAVAQASAGGAQAAEVCTIVAQEIDDTAEQREFLAEACPPKERIAGPGFAFQAPSQAMRAVEYAFILALPEAVLRGGGDHRP
jgi:small-conductance mechanosensitive channel